VVEHRDRRDRHFLTMARGFAHRHIEAYRRALSVAPAPASTTPERHGGLGLGVFIARTLLERTGAKVSFTNRPFRIMAPWFRSPGAPPLRGRETAPEPAS